MPDSRIIWTHRDPGKVITSLASLTNALQRMFTNRRDHVATAEEWLAKSQYAIESGMAFDDDTKEGWCQHLRFEDLMKDPIAAVRSIYANYGESPSALHVRRMSAWMEQRGRHSEGRHVYNPADFGWSYDDLAERFSAYSSRYGIGRE